MAGIDFNIDSLQKVFYKDLIRTPSGDAVARLMEPPIVAMFRDCEEIFREASPEWIFSYVQGGDESGLLLLIESLKRLGNLSLQAAEELRRSLDKYLEFVNSHTISSQKWEQILVSINVNDNQGHGFLVEYEGMKVVITCTHIVGNQRPSVQHLGQPIVGGQPSISHDVAIIPISRGNVPAISLPPDSGMAEHYLGDYRNKKVTIVRTWGRLCLETARIVGTDASNNTIQIEPSGHVQRGESGSPAFFVIKHKSCDGQIQDRLCLLGMLRARLMEKTRGGEQAVGAEIIPIAQILEAVREYHQRRGS